MGYVASPPRHRVLRRPSVCCVADLTPPLVKYLADEQKKYAATAQEIKEFTASIDKLPPLKVTEILNNLTAGTVVVIGPTSAAVVSESSIYKAAADESAQGQPTFQGEQAISSAFLPMINPEKVKVVFITTSSKPSTSQGEDGWSDMADRLRAVNFDVMEWSPQDQHEWIAKIITHVRICAPCRTHTITAAMW